MKRTFLWREGKVFYSQKGKGKAVILLHGFMESSRIWNYYSEMLSSYYRVISVDLPGHGKTECFGYVHEMELMAECVRGLMKHLRLRKVFLVGHSMGGYVALAFAEKYPDMVSGLCLFHSTAAADSEQRRKDRDRTIEVVKKNPMRLINETIPKLFFKKYKTHGRQIARMKKMAARTPVQGIVAALEGMKIRNDRTIVLKFAPYPVLFLAGKEDAIIPYKDLIKQAELPEASVVEILEDVGHMGFIEAKDRCWVTIRNFIKSPPKR